MLDNALKLGEHVILEGAQGCLLDIDQGTFPFVTSSITSRGNATHGAGIHPGHVEDVIGITKAYITRVGHGAMPTELDDEAGEHMGTVGHEFGTTTGRKRRCGWFDAVVMRHAQRINGFTGLALTKLDVLGGLDELKICVAYELDGKEITELPPPPLLSPAANPSTSPCQVSPNSRFPSGWPWLFMPTNQGKASLSCLQPLNSTLRNSRPWWAYRAPALVSVQTVMQPLTAFDSLSCTGEGSKGRGPPLGLQGRLAQLEERLVCNQKAGGSNPPASTLPLFDDGLGRFATGFFRCAQFSLLAPASNIGPFSYENTI